MKKIVNFFSFLSLILFFSMFNFNVRASSVCSASALSMFKIGENVYIQPNETKDSNVMSIGGDIYVNGTVNGNITSVGGNIYINGDVNGNVKSIGGSVSKGPKGNVSGKTKEIGGNFKGKFNFYDINRFKGMDLQKYNFNSLFISIVLGLILYGIMPHIIINMAWKFNNNFISSLQYGYGVLLLTILLSFVLTLSIVGILLIPFLFFILFILFILGSASLSIYIGKRITISLNKNVSELWCMVIGIIIIQFIKSISFISMGNIIYLLVIVPITIGIPLSNKLGAFSTWTRNYRKDFEYEWDKFKKR